MTDQPFAVPAALLFFVALPLVLGAVPRNRFYGVRTRKTLSEGRVWYPVNRVAGIALMVSCGVYGVVAVLRPYERHASDSFAIWSIHLLAFVAPLVLGLGVASWYAKRL